jgi:hypothetical protein
MTANLGYPTFEPPKWYGLWCPTLDCFLFVHFDLDLLLEIQLLASSKILTVPVNLDIELAKNNTLDNSCCINWTVTDPEKINFTFVYQKQDQIWSVDVQASKLRDIAEAQKVHAWFMFLLDWICWIDDNSAINNRVKNFINYVLELQEPDLKQKIYKILLLSATQQEATDQITQLKNEYKF